jgi:hypothetical protein
MMWTHRSSAYLQQAWDLAHSAENLEEEFEYVIEFKGKLASDSHQVVREYVAYVLERNGILFRVKTVRHLCVCVCVCMCVSVCVYACVCLCMQVCEYKK